MLPRLHRSASTEPTSSVLQNIPLDGGLIRVGNTVVSRDMLRNNTPVLNSSMNSQSFTSFSLPNVSKSSTPASRHRAAARDRGLNPLASPKAVPTVDLFSLSLADSSSVVAADNNPFQIVEEMATLEDLLQRETRLHHATLRRLRAREHQQQQQQQMAQERIAREAEARIAQWKATLAETERRVEEAAHAVLESRSVVAFQELEERDQILRWMVGSQERMQRKQLRTAARISGLEVDRQRFIAFEQRHREYGSVLEAQEFDALCLAEVNARQKITNHTAALDGLDSYLRQEVRGVTNKLRQRPDSPLRVAVLDRKFAAVIRGEQLDRDEILSEETTSWKALLIIGRNERHKLKRGEAALHGLASIDHHEDKKRTAIHDQEASAWQLIVDEYRRVKFDAWELQMQQRRMWNLQKDILRDALERDYRGFAHTQLLKANPQSSREPLVPQARAHTELASLSLVKRVAPLHDTPLLALALRAAKMM